MSLLRWLTFLLRSLTVIVIVLLFWISSFLLVLVFVQQWLALHWEILNMFLSQFPIKFIMGCPISSHSSSHADWDGLCDCLRDVQVLWEDIFKLGASPAASEFC